MQLDTIFKALGWAMAITPLAVFLMITFYMIRGAAKDDSVVMGLVLLGLAIFGIGVGILIIFYLADFTFAG